MGLLGYKDLYWNTNVYLFVVGIGNNKYSILDTSSHHKMRIIYNHSNVIIDHGKRFGEHSSVCTNLSQTFTYMIPVSHLIRYVKTHHVHLSLALARQGPICSVAKARARRGEYVGFWYVRYVRFMGPSCPAMNVWSRSG